MYSNEPYKWLFLVIYNLHVTEFLLYICNQFITTDAFIDDLRYIQGFLFVYVKDIYLDFELTGFL